jgi:cytochrome P450
MDTATAPSTMRLIPPTVAAPDGPLPLWRFLPTFVRNPLRSLPRQIYHEDSLAVVNSGRTTVWIAAPGLIEEVLVARADEFGKSPIEKRVFDLSLGDGILTSEGALWRWQRRVLARLRIGAADRPAAWWRSMRR